MKTTISILTHTFFLVFYMESKFSFGILKLIFNLVVCFFTKLTHKNLKVLYFRQFMGHHHRMIECGSRFRRCMTLSYGTPRDQPFFISYDDYLAQQAKVRKNWDLFLKQHQKLTHNNKDEEYSLLWVVPDYFINLIRSFSTFI